jgi:hypothetical protein
MATALRLPAALTRGKISRPESITSKVKKQYTDQNRHSQALVKTHGIFLFQIETNLFSLQNIFRVL